MGGNLSVVGRTSGQTARRTTLTPSMTRRTLIRSRTSGELEQHSQPRYLSSSHQPIPIAISRQERELRESIHAIEFDCYIKELDFASRRRDSTASGADDPVLRSFFRMRNGPAAHKSNGERERNNDNSVVDDMIFELEN